LRDEAAKEHVKELSSKQKAKKDAKALDRVSNSTFHYSNLSKALTGLLHICSGIIGDEAGCSSLPSTIYPYKGFFSPGIDFGLRERGSSIIWEWSQPRRILWNY
jgi:hypothetical protein